MLSKFTIKWHTLKMVHSTILHPVKLHFYLVLQSMLDNFTLLLTTVQFYFQIAESFPVSNLKNIHIKTNSCET